MNFKLKNRTILNGDIISPEIPYAEFNDDVTTKTMKDIISSLNNGHEMLWIYKKYRYDLNIQSVLNMIKEMDKVITKYDKELFLNNRENYKK